MKQFLFIALCVLVPHLVAGQCTSTQERPNWMDEGNRDLTSSYIKKYSGAGYSEKEAREKAYAEADGEQSRRTGQRVKVQRDGFEASSRATDELTIRSNTLDEYIEYCGRNGEFPYRVSVLMQIAKHPENSNLESVGVTKSYPFSPRVFIPGMAQLHKGSKAKGVLFIVGEAAMIGGIVAAESLRASYSSKVKSTLDFADQSFYNNNARNWKNIRSGFIAGAAVLYAWNVVDGWVAKGKKHVTFMGDNTLNVTPFASPYGNGLALTVNF